MTSTSLIRLSKCVTTAGPCLGPTSGWLYDLRASKTGPRDPDSRGLECRLSPATRPHTPLWRRSSESRAEAAWLPPSAATRGSLHTGYCRRGGQPAGEPPAVACGDLAAPGLAQRSLDRRLGPQAPLRWPGAPRSATACVRNARRTSEHPG